MRKVYTNQRDVFNFIDKFIVPILIILIAIAGGLIWFVYKANFG